MLKLLPELVLGPLLVAAATVAQRRWNARVGGLVSSLPAVVGPVLLIAVEQRGRVFASRAADGTLLGLVALSGFALAYAWAACRLRWQLSLAAGWACAAVLTLLVRVSHLGPGLATCLAVATISLLAAHRALPSPGEGTSPPPARGELRIRMALTAIVVAGLAAATLRVGALLGGMLVALPVLASVLAVSTHRRYGIATLLVLLRGMLAGMAGFVSFCAVVSLLLVRSGVPAAFATATVSAVAVQVLMLRAPQARAASAPA